MTFYHKHIWFEQRLRLSRLLAISYADTRRFKSYFPLKFSVQVAKKSSILFKSYIFFSLFILFSKNLNQGQYKLIHIVILKQIGQFLSKAYMFGITLFLSYPANSDQNTIQF